VAQGQVFERQLALAPEERLYGTGNTPQYVQHDRRSSSHRAGILKCLGADEFLAWSGRELRAQKDFDSFRPPIRS
jgi:hypothetical protein